MSRDPSRTALRRATATVAALALALGATACADDDGPATPEGAVTAPSADPTATATERGRAPAPHPAVTRPYSAGDAGRVLIALEENRIRLVGVDEARGWSHSVRHQDAERVTVVFIDPDREVVFDAVLDGDEVRVDLDQRGA